MKKAYIQVLSAAMLWGFMGVFVRRLTSCGLDQMQIGLLRTLTAAVVMFGVLLKKEKN